MRAAAGIRLALAAAAIAAASVAQALVVDADPAELGRAPGEGTGFEHVVEIGGRSGVYLGEGWVLTAAHVGEGEIALAGTAHAAVPGSWVGLRGPDGLPGPPDLGVFRVEPRPALPPLEIARQAPRPGEALLLVGCGTGRGDPVEWGGRTGYRWAPPFACRWGRNRVAATGLDVPRPGVSTRVFATLFSAGEPHEAKAAHGDSGGAAFARRGTGWVLAGLMISIETAPGQPPQTALDGNATHLADLSVYRDEILAATRLPH